jgi:hypothetical protein
LNWLGDLLDPWRGINGSKESCLNSFLSPTTSNINKESQVQCNYTPHFNGLADSSVYHRVHNSLVETLNIINSSNPVLILDEDESVQCLSVEPSSKPAQVVISNERD